MVDRGRGFTFCQFSKITAADKDTTRVKVETTMFQGRKIESNQVTAISIAFSEFDFIPSKVFEDFGDVSRFKFFGGKLKFIKKESFVTASHLRHFEISDTKIEEISSKAFEGAAANLEEIVIENCEIGKIASDAFDGLDKLTKLSLKRSKYSDKEFLKNLSSSVEILY